MRYLTPIMAAFVVCILTLPGCRPRPSEGEIGTFVATTPDDTTGLYTLTATEGSLLPLSSVTVVNSTSDDTQELFSDLNGAFYDELEGEIGDVLNISYSDPEGVLSIATIILPLQKIRYHGQLTFDGACLEFERDDLTDEAALTETRRFELVGPLTDVIKEELTPGESVEGTLFGEPILFGIGSCDLPLLEAAQLRADGDTPPAVGFHGRQVKVTGEEGEACFALEATAEIPFDVFNPPDESTPQGSFIPVSREGTPLLQEATLGRWMSLETPSAPLEHPSRCGLPSVEVLDTWLDTGERLDLNGRIVDTSTAQGACLRLEVPGGGPSFEVTGPILTLFRNRLPPEDVLPLAGYRVETIGGAPAQGGECGLPLILAGLPGQGGGPPPTQEQVDGGELP